MPWLPPEPDVGTQEKRQAAFLAFVAVFGGGTLAYEAARAWRDTRPRPATREEAIPRGPLAVAAGLTGVGLALQATKEAADEVGAGPLALGGAGIFAVAWLLRSTRR